LNNLDQKEVCEEENKSCYPNRRYRTYDGSCNNLEKTWWGMANKPYKRLLNNKYDDGLCEPRTKSAIPGKNLPGARLLSMNIYQPNHIDATASVLLEFFGQFITHELSALAISKNAKGEEIVCGCNFKSVTVCQACFNIPVPSNDFFNRNCIPFTRAASSATVFKCASTVREQFNKLSSWIDGGAIYGSSKQIADGLRTFQDGQLLTAKDPHGFTILPYKDGKTSSCPKECFKTGETRAEENAFLTGFHTLWLREHNRIASDLKSVNPRWNDERLYQETRRIVIAELNHIVYNEYLPILLGDQIARTYDLYPKKKGYAQSYDPNIYPAIINEFAGAAFRLHFMIYDEGCKTDINLQEFGCKNIGAFIDNSTEVHSSTEDLIRSTLTVEMQASYPQMDTSINDNMFRNRTSMGSINVQRGRDLGLRPYNDYRVECGLPRASSFDDLSNFRSETISLLKTLYAHVDDIDLFVGGSSEIPLEDGFLGATFSCIIAKQFSELKRADRFYYEYGFDSNIRFSSAQLDELRKVSMRQVLCDNVELFKIQEQPFILHDEENPTFNPYVGCSKRTVKSLNQWKAN
jgi:peroxidase